MNTLEFKIQQDLVLAMKSKDLDKANTLRGIKTAFIEFKTAPKGNKEPSDSDLCKILQRLIKQRKNAGDLYIQNGREDLANKEFAECEIISSYLPKLLIEEELKDIISKQDLSLGIGKVIGNINKEYPGRVDNTLLSNLLKSL